VGATAKKRGGPAAKETCRDLAGVYGLYLAAAVVLTWPVAARIGREIPGAQGDPQMFVWNIWWFKFSLFDLHRNPLWCPWISWPFGESFAFHTNTILYDAVAVLLSGLGIGYGTSIGLLFLNSFALTGLGTYLWCRGFGAGRRGAFVGGFVVAFSVYRFGRGMCHYNLLATGLLPFFLIALRRAMGGFRARDFAVAAVLVLLALWQDVQLALFDLFFGAFYAGAILLRGGWRRFADGRFFRGAGVAAALFLAGSLPYWSAVVPLLARGEYAVRDRSPATEADVLSFFVPWPHHWLFGRFTAGVYSRFRFPDIETAYVGWVALVLAAAGFRAGRAEGRRIAWLGVAAATFFVLSFGEELQVAGERSFHVWGRSYSLLLPGKLLAYIPVLRQFRVYSRFIFLAVFALSVPVALAIDDLERRWRRRGRQARFVAPAALLLVSIEVAPLPFPTHPYVLPNYAPYKILEEIASEPETATVFAVPPTIQQPHELYMQMFHRKPIYGGGFARRPYWLVRRYYEMPAIGEFFWERQDRLDERKAAEALSAEFVERFVEFYNIKYLILAPSPKYEITRRLVESRFPIIGRRTEGRFVVYTLRRPVRDRPLHIDLSRPWGRLYVGRGFEPPSPLGAWAAEREAELFLPIGGRSWKVLLVEMTPFVYDRSVRQTAELFLNGRRLGRVALEPRLAYYQFAIPRGALDGRPCSTLTFRFAYCVSGAEKGISDDRCKRAAAVRCLHVLSEPRRGLPIVGE